MISALPHPKHISMRTRKVLPMLVVSLVRWATAQRGQGHERQLEDSAEGLLPGVGTTGLQGQVTRSF